MKDFYALTSYPRTEADWDVLQFLDAETGEAVVLSYRVRGTEDERLVMPVRLASAVLYNLVDPFEGKTVTRRTGRDLMENGLRIELAPESARIVHLCTLSTRGGARS
jgi:hypothetical protein